MHIKTMLAGVAGLRLGVASAPEIYQPNILAAEWSYTPGGLNTWGSRVLFEAPEVDTRSLEAFNRSTGEVANALIRHAGIVMLNAVDTIVPIWVVAAHRGISFDEAATLVSAYLDDPSKTPGEAALALIAAQP